MNIPDYSLAKLMWVFLAALIHAATGYLFVSYFTPYRPIYGFVGGLIPDFDVVFIPFDYGFPVVHRGFMHTPFFVGLVLCVIWVVGHEGMVHGFGVGMILHLVFDSLSGWGIMWLWPADLTYIHIPLGINRPQSLALITAVALTIAILLPPKKRVEQLL